MAWNVDRRGEHAALVRQSRALEQSLSYAYVDQDTLATRRGHPPCACGSRRGIFGAAAAHAAIYRRDTYTTTDAQRRPSQAVAAVVGHRIRSPFRFFFPSCLLGPEACSSSVRRIIVGGFVYISLAFP